MVQYLYDESGRHTGVLHGMAKQENSTLIAPPEPDGIEYRFTNGEWAPLQADKRITRLAFINRFTMDEWIALDTASASVPTIKYFLMQVNAARYIDLGRDDVKMGVHLLAANGMLGQARASEILDTPILQLERVDLVSL